MDSPLELALAITVVAALAVFAVTCFVLITRPPRATLADLRRDSKAMALAQRRYFDEHGHYGNATDVEVYCGRRLRAIDDRDFRFGVKWRSFVWRHRTDDRLFEVTGDPNGDITLTVDGERRVLRTYEDAEALA